MLNYALSEFFSNERSWYAISPSRTTVRGARASRFIALTTERDPNMALGAGLPCANADRSHYGQFVCQESTYHFTLWYSSQIYDLPNNLQDIYDQRVPTDTTKAYREQLRLKIQICVVHGYDAEEGWPTPARSALPKRRLRRQSHPLKKVQMPRKRSQQSKSHVRKQNKNSCLLHSSFLRAFSKCLSLYALFGSNSAWSYLVLFTFAVCDRFGPV